MCCLQLLGLAIAWRFGMYEQIIAIDNTKITILIITVHIIATILAGYATWKRTNVTTEFLWYTAETQLSLGMIGTLIGFIIMLNAAFGHIEAASLETIKTSIASIGSGMGIAIRATLLGLISGVLIKAQLINLEKSCETEQV